MSDDDGPRSARTRPPTPLDMLRTVGTQGSQGSQGSQSQIDLSGGSMASPMGTIGAKGAKDPYLATALTRSSDSLEYDNETSDNRYWERPQLDKYPFDQQSISSDVAELAVMENPFNLQTTSGNNPYYNNNTTGKQLQDAAQLHDNNPFRASATSLTGAQSAYSLSGPGSGSVESLEYSPAITQPSTNTPRTLQDAFSATSPQKSVQVHNAPTVHNSFYGSVNNSDASLSGSLPRSASNQRPIYLKHAGDPNRPHVYRDRQVGQVERQRALTDNNSNAAGSGSNVIGVVPIYEHVGTSSTAFPFANNVLPEHTRKSLNDIKPPRSLPLLPQVTIVPPTDHGDHGDDGSVYSDPPETPRSLDPGKRRSSMLQAPLGRSKSAPKLRHSEGSLKIVKPKDSKDGDLFRTRTSSRRSHTQPALVSPRSPSVKGRRSVSSVRSSEHLLYRSASGAYRQSSRRGASLQSKYEKTGKSKSATKSEIYGRNMSVIEQYIDPRESGKVSEKAMVPPSFPDDEYSAEPKTLYGVEQRQCSRSRAQALLALFLFFPPCWLLMGTGFFDEAIGIIPRREKQVALGLSAFFFIIVIVCIIIGFVLSGH